MLKVLYEDNHCIAIVKPPGVPVMPDSSGDECVMDLVKKYLKEKYDKPGNVFLGLVHRLDRSTGGAMVFAKTSKGASRISEQIRSRRMEKTYFAAISGIPDDESGELHDYLIKDQKNNKSRVVSKNTTGAKEAILRYSVIKENSEFSLLSIKLITGRHHQIRVQFASRGHILYGDVKYGSPKKAALGLWAAELLFFKPVGGDPITVRCEPDYLKEPWRRLS